MSRGALIVAGMLASIVGLTFYGDRQDGQRTSQSAAATNNVQHKRSGNVSETAMALVDAEKTARAQPTPTPDAEHNARMQATAEVVEQRRQQSLTATAEARAQAQAAAEQRRAEAVDLLGAAAHNRQEGQLGLALELARQALGKWSDYPEARSFLTEVAPQATTQAKEAQAQATAAAQQATAQARATAQVLASNKGMVFGDLAVIGSGLLSQIGVPVINTTNQVKTFTVMATFKRGDQIVGTAVGSVNDLSPRERRVAVLASLSGPPKGYDSVRVNVDTLVQEARSTRAAEVASKITFGKLAAQSAFGGFTTLVVETTNGDTRAHTFTVQASFYKGGNLIGLAVGSVNDLAPGQTKTATLTLVGSYAGANEAYLGIDTLVL